MPLFKVQLPDDGVRQVKTALGNLRQWVLV